MRFRSNLKFSVRNRADRTDRPLQPAQIEAAEEYWIRQTQVGMETEMYPRLSPFVDDSGTIRVGSRLNRSQFPYEEINPVLLPAKSHISTLIMRDTHRRVSHAGRERTMCESRAKYWILHGRNLATKIAREFVACRKERQPPHVTLMGDLPVERMQFMSPPFGVTGVDLFGPFGLKYGRNKSVKAWGAIFTCATVRAVYLEIVESSFSEAFLQALRSFAATHGWPETIITDNGGSFVGAEAELRKMIIDGRRLLEDFSTLHRFKWLFISPYSPHQVELHESLIKSKRSARCPWLLVTKR